MYVAFVFLWLITNRRFWAISIPKTFEFWKVKVESIDVELGG